MIGRHMAIERELVEQRTLVNPSLAHHRSHSRFDDESESTPRLPSNRGFSTESVSLRRSCRSGIGRVYLRQLTSPDDAGSAGMCRKLTPALCGSPDQINALSS